MMEGRTLELRQLNTFCVAASTLNFTRTAEMLNYAQSSVTMQIQALEEELGVRLFERLGKSLKLTSAGERLLGYSQHILRLVDEATTAVSAGDEPQGTLTIGSAESLCTYRLPPLLRTFRERYPKVKLVLHPSTCEELSKGVLDGRYDAAFTLDQPIRSPLLFAETLLEEELIVLAHPDHPLTRKNLVTPLDLAGGEVLLMTEAGCSYRSLFEQSIHEDGVRPESLLEFGSVEALKQCTMAGMGITILPRMAVQAELESGRLAPLPWAKPVGPLPTQLIYHRDKWMSPALRGLIEIAREVLKIPMEAVDVS